MLDSNPFRNLGTMTEKALSPMREKNDQGTR